MDLQILKPRDPATVVLLPDGSGSLPPDGTAVLLDSYWLRRIADGDVVRVEVDPPEVDQVAPTIPKSPAKRGA